MTDAVIPACHEKDATTYVGARQNSANNPLASGSRARQRKARIDILIFGVKLARFSLPCLGPLIINID
jgi:hypothetical protein